MSQFIQKCVGKISLIPQSYVDDDIRVRIDGVDVCDTQWCNNWYKGDELISKTGTVPKTLPEYWRKFSITRAQAVPFGLLLKSGMTLNLDVFDGWGSQYKTAAFGVWIEYLGGQSHYETIGTNSNALASTNPDGTLYVMPVPRPSNYYQTNATLFTWHPNGSLVIPHCPNNIVPHITGD